MPYTQSSLQNLNIQYGPGWITNIRSTSYKEKYTLYPTGNYSVDTGRDYVAIPTNKILTPEDKRKLNII
jgi:hypothetical protein